MHTYNFGNAAETHQVVTTGFNGPAAALTWVLCITDAGGAWSTWALSGGSPPVVGGVLACTTSTAAAGDFTCATLSLGLTGQFSKCTCNVTARATITLVDSATDAAATIRTDVSFNGDRPPRVGGGRAVLREGRERVGGQPSQYFLATE